ncbi:MAG: hypothetical protein ABEK04_03780 [Candidatus Nanohalobium sp.]
MIIYGEDILHEDEVYRAISAKDTQSDEAFIKYLQPRDDFLYSQEEHEEALNYLFEQEEDLEVLEKNLTPDEGL